MPSAHYSTRVRDPPETSMSVRQQQQQSSIAWQQPSMHSQQMKQAQRSTRHRQIPNVSHSCPFCARTTTVKKTEGRLTDNPTASHAEERSLGLLCLSVVLGVETLAWARSPLVSRCGVVGGAYRGLGLDIGCRCGRSGSHLLLHLVLLSGLVGFGLGCHCGRCVLWEGYDSWMLCLAVEGVTVRQSLQQREGAGSEKDDARVTRLMIWNGR